jgi:hypothetical protein
LEEAKFAEDRAAHLQSPTVAGQDQARLVGNRRGAGNDTVAQQEDQLNFENYVQAFCDLIRSADTKPPLTIGIFGSWGMGKSFLLKEIERSIRELQKDPQDSLDPREQRKAWKETRRRRRQDLQQGRTDPSVSYVHVVRFNAWEYSATEVVWPGLVRKIMDRLEVETSNGAAGRLAARLRRNLRRQIMRNRSRLYAAAIIVPVLIAIGITQIQADSLVLGGAALAIGAGLIKVASDGLSRPISQWVTTLFEDQDYGKQIGYMADIRDDLEFLANRLRRDQGRILVTIDDLDRCEPEKAAEVLEAVNLLLNFDSFIVCLGIDARVVTRAVEEHYKGLLGPAGASGYEYLDKVVQIPFRIPEPTGPDLKAFLTALMGNPVPLGGEEDDETEQEQPKPRRARGQHRSDRSVEPPVDFTYLELQAFDELIPLLRPNPRHIKRMVNVYRLVRNLADYRNEAAIRDDPASTVRWLVMCGQWPYTSFKMLQRLDQLIEDEKALAATVQLARESDKTPLRCLYDEVTLILSHNKQEVLDDDINLLLQLLDQNEERPGWDLLQLLRQYTINFNPAVEAEIVPATDEVAAQP